MAREKRDGCSVVVSGPARATANEKTGSWAGSLGQAPRVAERADEEADCDERGAEISEVDSGHGHLGGVGGERQLRQECRCCADRTLPVGCVNSPKNREGEGASQRRERVGTTFRKSSGGPL